MEKDNIKDLATKGDVAEVKEEVNQLGQRVDRVETGLIIVEQKVDHLEQKFDQGFKQLNDKFNIVINILDGHSKILERLDHERIFTNKAIERLEKQVEENTREIKMIKEHLHIE